MAKYDLGFDQSAGNQLDEFALLARQDYNLGKGNGWFSHFRGGLYGHYSRVNGAAIHYANIHNWLPVPQALLVEYNLSSFLFNADSALECFVYALNALGNSIDPASFQDVSKTSTLMKISPRNVTGDERNKALPGYSKYFPSTQEEWGRQNALIKTIVDLHDVSKHRKTIYIGGKIQSDAPPGFFEAVGVRDSDSEVMYWPSEEVLLMTDPKQADRPPSRREDYEVLEEVGPAFCDFINNITKLAMKDAKATIKLKEPKIREP